MKFTLKRSFFLALALVALIGLQPQAARAQDNNAWNAFWAWFSHGQDPRLTGVGVAVGAGAGAADYLLTKKHGVPAVRHMSYGTAWGVTSYACAVVYPMIGTVVLNRPLTPREAYVGIADCVVPILGGWFVDSILPHDAWTDGTPPKPVKHHTKG